MIFPLDAEGLFHRLGLQWRGGCEKLDRKFVDAQRLLLKGPEKPMSESRE